ncbi:DNA-3-methyladenine glycosylase [Ornithinibacillus bavariensis]|uniref:DNA-3-methyladenine glycosylase n=1 Tax=Ornithinibacillus bavariensis TaxID=545502 RepID=UPI003D1A0EDC
MMDLTLTPLPQSFYEGPTLELAKRLLGCILVKETDEGISGGVIVETEAYLGSVDQAAHSFQNRRTKRTEIMFQEPGHVYTYQMHTHTLVNVVSGPIGIPEAILIRAIEPSIGIDLMLTRRPVKSLQNLTSGPGKLTKALHISMDDYGKTFYNSSLFIAKGKKPLHIEQGKRIGIDNSGEARDYPYRFLISGNPFVSR